MYADEVDRRATRCQFCRQPVIWAVEPDGGKLPLDTTPHKDGNFALDFSDGEMRAGKLTRGQADGMRRAQIGTYRRHALSCSQAHRWAKSLSGTYAKPQRGLRSGRKKAT